MPKAETTFRPIGNSDQRLHGHTAVLISGFSASEQQQLHALFRQWDLNSVPLILIGADTLPLTLAQATRLPDRTNFGQTPELPRAVVMSGLMERQLHRLMQGYREEGFPRPLWASITPHSESWTVKYLLVELLKEREAMREAMLAQKKQQPPTPAADGL